MKATIPNVTCILHDCVAWIIFLSVWPWISSCRNTYIVRHCLQIDTRERQKLCFIWEAETLLLSMSDSQNFGLWPGLPMLADKVRAMYSSYFIDVFYAFVVVSIVYIAFQFARVFYIFVWRPLSVLRKLQRQGVPGCKFVPLVGQTRELLHVRRWW